MFTVSVRQLKALVNAVPPDITLMAEGPPGIGKTSGVALAAEESGRALEVLIASQRPAEDFLGLPDLDRKGGVSKYLPFPWLRRVSYDVTCEEPDESVKAIVFLDEVNCAPIRTQLALQRLVLERRIDDRAVQPNVQFVMAGNRIEDAAFAQAMPSSLANRILWVTVEPNFDEWVEDFATQNVRHEIISFLRSRPGRFMVFDPSKEVKAFPSPRSWTQASKVLTSCVALGEGLLTTALSGCVGEGTAVEVTAHIKLAGTIPTPEQVEAAPESEKVPSEPSALFFAVGSLVSVFRAAPTDVRIDAFLRWIWRTPEQFRVLFLRDAIRAGDEAKKVLVSCKRFCDPKSGAYALIKDLFV